MTASSLPSLLYLWDRRTLYLGPMRQSLQLSLAAARLIVSLDGCLRFKQKHQRREICCRSALFPAGLNVRIETEGSGFANCHLDVTGFDHAVLRQLMRQRDHQVCYELDDEERFAAVFSELRQSQPDTNAAYQVLDQLINPPMLIRSTPCMMDPRVLRVIELIKGATGANLSIEHLARQVNLSASRLVHLFKRQVGIPIRRYRLWHRLYLSTVTLARGGSLTDAALAAGFTDSSHFSKTYRAILGMRPSLVFSPQRNMRIITEDLGQM